MLRPSCARGPTSVRVEEPSDLAVHGRLGSLQKPRELGGGMRLGVGEDAQHPGLEVRPEDRHQRGR
jgi:hypothetical protein